MNYNKVNNIIGWVIFFFAFMVYLLTMSPTASFWDCGEFIACSNELQVPHPPGAPFFLILGRFFALFSFGDVTQVAFWVNMISVLSSAFVSLFVFWTATYLARKILANNVKQPSLPNIVAIMGAGAVAALTSTFADSIWFNAVEAEVYALSSFFTAIVVWLIFKWEARADQPDNLKWIILIAFVMGISIGAHLLNLLTIPALAFIYYFRKFDINIKGAIITFLISVGILGLIQYGLIQSSVEIAWGFERFFTGTEEMVNGVYKPTGMGLPMGTGLTIFLILVLGTIIGTVVFTTKDNLWQKVARGNSKRNDLRVVLNTIGWSMVVILIGYSSYAMIVIRANAGTPINENDPSSIASMLSYLKREQYGDRPLIRGVRYNKQSMDPRTHGREWKVVKERRKFVNLSEDWLLAEGTYQLEDGKSITVNKAGVASNFSGTANDGKLYTTELKDGRPISINTETKTVSRVRDRYVWSGYKQDIQWLKGKVFLPRMHSASHYRSGRYGYANYIPKNRQRNPQDPMDDKVTTGDDIRFFMDYQVRHMYFRYFMWNFAGREGDIQDMGWESGFASLSDLPDELANHQGKNHYYLLPLLLGIFGMVFQFYKNPKDATSILLLFFFTGLAIILYLNQTPQQPRERDYSYAGSFQTFAIWVGLGVIGLFELLRPVLKGGGAYAATAIGLLIAPVIMGVQNWDDHDRNNRRVAPESAYNLLNSCGENGILFTNGDNDTFPLWYLQEVEGVRTDVRVVNLSLLNTDWYIDQMKKQQNASPPLPIRSPQSRYIGDKNSTMRRAKGQEWTLEVDKQKVLANGTVPAEFASYIPKEMKWKVRVRGGGENTYLLKQDWMILDIMTTNAKNGWERPIYFSSTIPPTSYISLEPFFYVEGLANRVIPVNLSKLPLGRFAQQTDPYSRGGQKGRLNKERSYELVTNKFKYGNLKDSDLYIDDHIRRTIVGNLTSMIFRTSNAFVDEMEYQAATSKNLENQIGKVDSTNTSLLDSINGLISNAKVAEQEAAKKAEEVLLIVEGKISDEARGNDVIFPMFAGSLWIRMKKEDKATEYFTKVLDKAEEWQNYFEKKKKKLPDHDRIMGTLTFLVQEAQKMSDKGIAARAADLVFRDTGDPNYQNLSRTLKNSGGAQDPSKELNLQKLPE